MLTENTVTKLQKMHLIAMAKAFKDQLTDPNMAGVSFEDRFGLLVDHEWTTRKNNHLKRLIRNAAFAESGACVEDIEYHADRNLDKAQIARLASCDYIIDHHNVMLLGATGSGKTYLACALGVAAVRNFLAVKYVRLPELLTELAIARSNGTYRKVVQQYKKPSLLILDEWLLYPLKETEARDLLEIVEARYRKASTIFCSQFDVPGWRDKIGDPILADAICDRIVHDSYPLVIDCKESMLYESGVNLIFLNEPLINTSVFDSTKNNLLNINIETGNTAVDDFFKGNVQLINNFMMALAEQQIKAAFEQSEKEVTDLHSRISQGIREAKKNGVKIGLSKGSTLTTKKSIDCKAIIIKHSKDFGGSLEDPEVIKLCGCSRNSYYKYKKEVKAAI